MIASIIESCWLTHPEERPAIEEIIDQLEMYKPTPQEEQKIVDSLKAEVKENNAHAQYNLALRYFKGAGVKKSFEVAYGLFCQSAKQGCCFAKIYLVIMHVKGLGTPLNKQAALTDYKEILKEQVLVEKCPAVVNQLNLLLFPPQAQPAQKSHSLGTSTHGQGMFDKRVSDPISINPVSKTELKS